MESLLQSLCYLDPRPIIVLVPIAAFLEVLYLVSQDLNFFAQFLYLFFVFKHKSIWMDLFVDWKFVVWLYYFTVSELKSIHAERKHFRWLDNPVCFSGVAFGSLINLVPFNGISKSIFPRDIKIFFICNLKQNIADGRILSFWIFFPIPVLILYFGVPFANKRGINCFKLFLCYALFFRQRSYDHLLFSLFMLRLWLVASIHERALGHESSWSLTLFRNLCHLGLWLLVLSFSLRFFLLFDLVLKGIFYARQ